MEGPHGIVNCSSCRADLTDHAIVDSGFIQTRAVFEPCGHFICGRCSVMLLGMGFPVSSPTCTRCGSSVTIINLDDTQAKVAEAKRAERCATAAATAAASPFKMQQTLVRSANAAAAAVLPVSSPSPSKRVVQRTASCPLPESWEIQTKDSRRRRTQPNLELESVPETQTGLETPKEDQAPELKFYSTSDPQLEKMLLPEAEPNIKDLVEDDEFSEDPEIHAEHVTRRMSEIDLLVTTGNIRHLICDFLSHPDKRYHGPGFTAVSRFLSFVRSHPLGDEQISALRQSSEPSADVTRKSKCEVKHAFSAVMPWGSMLPPGPPSSDLSDRSRRSSETFLLVAYQRVLAATTGLDVAARWLARLDEMGKPSSTIVFRSPYEAQLRDLTVKNAVFLGGSCGSTTWRYDIAMPYLDSNGINYYNPQVKSWHEGLVEIEANAKRESHIMLFVIDNATRALVSIMEVVEHICRGKLTFVVMSELVPPTDFDGNGATAGAGELRDIQRLRRYMTDVAVRHGVSIYETVEEACADIAKLNGGAKANGSPTSPVSQVRALQSLTIRATDL